MLIPHSNWNFFWNGYFKNSRTDQQFFHCQLKLSSFLLNVICGHQMISYVLQKRRQNMCHSAKSAALLVWSWWLQIAYFITLFCQRHVAWLIFTTYKVNAYAYEFFSDTCILWWSILRQNVTKALKKFFTQQTPDNVKSPCFLLL